MLEDFTIYSYDAPGHGNSSSGDQIMFDFHEVARQIIKKRNVKIIISHSFGSVATTYSLAKMPNYKVDKCVMITTPSSFTANVNNQCFKMGLSRRSINHFYDRISKERDLNVNDLNVAKFVKKIDVGEALILHDVHDKVIPFSESQIVANKWRAAQLIPIKDTGQFRILRTPSVTEQVIKFIN